MLQNWYCEWWQPTRVTLDSSLELRFNAVVTLVRLKSRRANSYVKYLLASAWTTSHIPQMSGQTPDVQLRVMDAVLLHYRTPHTQLGPVFQCFPFCYNSNISLIYCGCPTLRAMATAFLHYRITRTQLSQVSQCFAKSEPLTSNSVQTSAWMSTWTSTQTPMPILHYPTIYHRPSTFPRPADSTHRHFPRSSPI